MSCDFSRETAKQSVREGPFGFVLAWTTQCWVTGSLERGCELSSPKLQAGMHTHIYFRLVINGEAQ
jgi:hypothetical protein